MAIFDLETCIKNGVEKALNKPIVNGKSITEWAAIGMKAPHWISVNDKLPDNDDEYIVAIVTDEERYVTSDHWVKLSRHWFLFDTEDAVVTHWMPLPEPPKEGDAE